MKFTPSPDGSEHADHRSPRTAGRADYNYHRPKSPNFAMNKKTYRKLTPDQIKEYNEGYEGR